LHLSLFRGSVFALSQQINKQNVWENNNLLCAGNKVLVKYLAQGSGFNPTQPFAYALAITSLTEVNPLSTTTVRCEKHRYSECYKKFCKFYMHTGM